MRPSFPRSSRRRRIKGANSGCFDALIIGGGSGGAAIFDRLSRASYRVLLIDKSDFAGATSQASAMMIWGDLPGVGRGSFIRVAQLSAARDNLVRSHGTRVTPRKFRYLPTVDCGRRAFSARAALYAYWLLSAGRRSFPRKRTEFPEADFLRGDKFPYAFDYEEAIIRTSDARFVLEWLLCSDSSDRIALNYCGLDDARFDHRRNTWSVGLHDYFSGCDIGGVQAKMIINAAGGWTDEINEKLKITSRFRHELAKGVFIALQRFAGHESPLMIETDDPKGSMALVPWGAVSLWGPTQSRIDDITAGYQPTEHDVRFLLGQLNAHLAAPVTPQEIVSLRCGVRPLVVRRDHPGSHEMASIPREFRVDVRSEKNCISVYGGKITSCEMIANAVARAVADRITPTGRLFVPATPASIPRAENFPRLDFTVVPPRWSADHEMCCTLDDYLRRRTNIAQQIPRGGLGSNSENRDRIQAIALELFEGDGIRSALAVQEYERRIELEFDSVISACSDKDTIVKIAA